MGPPLLLNDIRRFEGLVDSTLAHDEQFAKSPVSLWSSAAEDQSADEFEFVNPARLHGCKDFFAFFKVPFKLFLLFFDWGFKAKCSEKCLGLADEKKFLRYSAEEEVSEASKSAIQASYLSQHSGYTDDIALLVNNLITQIKYVSEKITFWLRKS